MEIDRSIFKKIPIFCFITILLVGFCPLNNVLAAESKDLMSGRVLRVAVLHVTNYYYLIYFLSNILKNFIFLPALK